jgi:hypothetical protein
MSDLVKDCLEGLEVPICDVCDAPVFMFARDNALLLHPGGVHFTAFCHGDMERVHVTEEDMRAMLEVGVSEFRFARAFVQKGSPSGETPLLEEGAL